MKDIKIQNVKPIADPKTVEKGGRKDKVAGQSFNETLNSTVANLNDLNNRIAGEGATVTGTDSASIKEGISSAKESFDKMMAEKQNLFQLYQRITNKEDS
ncbi:MAG: hypothetical protein O7E56_08310 [SAR324 cluster bacterium]|nr:hypothetical protein [SAR324 cluster bacterium]